MSEPGTASVVPIALVMNGKTGYTIWAAPWVEDGEEWQAFLGAGGRVWLFEDLGDLVATLRSPVDNDLTDHPAWPMLRTLPADQLAPDDGYRFDLDEVPDLTRAEADPEVVERVTESLDMVERIAECCDNGTLLHLLEQPGFVDLLGYEEDEEYEDEDEEDDAAEEELDEDEDVDEDLEQADHRGDEQGAGAQRRGAARVEAEELDTERPAAAPKSGRVGLAEDDEDEDTSAKDAAAKDHDEDEEDNEDEDDEDEDDEEEEDEDDDDAWAEIGTAIRTAWPGVLKRLEECVTWRTAADLPEQADGAAAAVAVAEAEPAAGDEDDDSEADTEFWDSVGIMPVELMLPSGTGYTLRCYVDDEPRFLGADMTVHIFRSREGLEAFCRNEDNHDLAGLETWTEVREAEYLDATPPRAERYDLVSVDAQLIGGPTVADIRLVRGAVDAVQDLAEYCELAGVQAAFSPDAPLGNTVNELFATSVGSSMLPSYWSGEGGAAQWRTVVDEIDSCLRWHD